MFLSFAILTTPCHLDHTLHPCHPWPRPHLVTLTFLPHPHVQLDSPIILCPRPQSSHSTQYHLPPSLYPFLPDPSSSIPIITSFHSLLSLPPSFTFSPPPVTPSIVTPWPPPSNLAHLPLFFRTSSFSLLQIAPLLQPVCPEENISISWLIHRLRPTSSSFSASTMILVDLLWVL